MSNIKPIMIAIAIIVGIYMTGIAFCTQAKAAPVMVETVVYTVKDEARGPYCVINTEMRAEAVAFKHFLDGLLNIEAFVKRLITLDVMPAHLEEQGRLAVNSMCPPLPEARS
jgi:hypothetical protein